MSIFMWLCYILIGFMLFVGIKFLVNKYSLSRFDSLIFSVIFLMIVAGVFSGQWNGFNDNLFLICVFSFIIDLIYTTYFLEKDFFDRSSDNIFYYIVLIGCSFLLNQGFFNRVISVFPTGEDFRIILWLLVIVYLYQFTKGYHIFKDKSKDLIKLSSESIIVSYAKLKHKYIDEIDIKNKDLELIVFSIMIYENYRCPDFKRKLNNFLFKIDNKPRKLGIMQVESKKFISDVDSIDIVSKKIEKMLTNKTKNKPIDVITKYIGDNSLSVISIYNELVKFSKK